MNRFTGQTRMNVLVNPVTSPLSAQNKVNPEGEMSGRPPSEDSWLDIDELDNDKRRANSLYYQAAAFVQNRKWKLVLCCVGLICIAAGIILYYLDNTGSQYFYRALFFVAAALFAGMLAEISIIGMQASLEKLMSKASKDKDLEYKITWVNFYFSTVRITLTKLVWCMLVIIAFSIAVPRSSDNSITPSWQLAYYHVSRMLGILALLLAARMVSRILRQWLAQDFGARSFRPRIRESLAHEHFIAKLRGKEGTALLKTLYQTTRNLTVDATIDPEMWQTLMQYIISHHVDGSEPPSGKLALRKRSQSSSLAKKARPIAIQIFARILARLEDLNRKKELKEVEEMVPSPSLEDVNNVAPESAFTENIQLKPTIEEQPVPAITDVNAKIEPQDSIPTAVEANQDSLKSKYDDDDDDDDDDDENEKDDDDDDDDDDDEIETIPALPSARPNNIDMQAPPVNSARSHFNEAPPLAITSARAVVEDDLESRSSRRNMVVPDSSMYPESTNILAEASSTENPQNTNLDDEHLKAERPNSVTEQTQEGDEAKVEEISAETLRNQEQQALKDEQLEKISAEQSMKVRNRWRRAQFASRQQPSKDLKGDTITMSDADFAEDTHRLSKMMKKLAKETRKLERSSSRSEVTLPSHSSTRVSSRMIMEEEFVQAFKEIDPSVPWDKLWKKYIDIENTGFITWQRFRKRMLSMFEARFNLALTVLDAQAVIKSMDGLIMSGLLVIVVIISLTMYSSDFVSLLASLGTIIVGYSFIFGSSVQECFDNVIFMFGMHPYDVGDVLLIDDRRFRVTRIRLLTTDFVRTDGSLIRMSNRLLRDKAFINVSTSEIYAQDFSTLIPACDATEEFMQTLQSEINKFVAQHLDMYTSISSFAYDLVHPLDRSGELSARGTHPTHIRVRFWVVYAFTFEEIKRVTAARTTFLIFIAGALRRLGVAKPLLASAPSHDTAGSDHSEQYQQIDHSSPSTLATIEEVKEPPEDIRGPMNSIDE